MKPLYPAPVFPFAAKSAARAATALVIAAVSHAAIAGGAWSPTHVVQGTFAASSPPEAPLVAMNALGHAVYAWNATSAVRTADRLPTGVWTASQGLPGGATGAGPVAVAIGRGELVAVAWSTVATRYVPSKLMVSLRPAGGSFLPAVEVAPGTRAGEIKLGIDCSGAVTVLWNGPIGVGASTLPGLPTVPGSCNGTPGPGPWTPPVAVSNGHVGASLADLSVNDAGDVLAVWQEGASGNPSSIVAATRAAGGQWELPATISAPSAQATWNPKPGLDAAGNAAIGYLDGPAMKVALRPAAGAWQPPVTVSGTQQVQYPALAVNEAGDVLAAWLATDPVSGTAVWQRLWHAGAWSAAGRLSARSDAPFWPSAAMSGDGSLAIVSAWTDDTALAARAAILRDAVWTRQSLGAAYWGGTVPAAAGGGKASAAWARTVGGNPNAAQLVGRGGTP